MLPNPIFAPIYAAPDVACAATNSPTPTPPPPTKPAVFHGFFFAAFERGLKGV
jgi:hypothetical protein